MLSRVAASVRHVSLPLFDLAQQAEERHRRLARTLGPLMTVTPRWQADLVRLLPGLQRMAELWGTLLEGATRAQDLAAQRGWYLGMLDYSMPEIARVVALAEAGDADALDDWVEARTTARLPATRGAATKAFPARAHILHQAFDAHDREQYAVSVPTLLAQADGMHHDLLAQHLFTNRRTKHLKKALATRLGEDPSLPLSSFAFLALRPLLTPNALFQTTGQRDRRWGGGESPGPLNRHGVLHGTDLGYATERRALQAVALIDFLAWAARDLRSMPSCPASSTPESTR